MRARAYFLTACLAVLALPAAPATAVTRSDGLLLTADKPVVQRSYPAMTGNPANAGNGMVNGRTCQIQTYCDVVKLDIDPKTTKFYAVIVTLTWPNPRLKQGDGGNNLDMAVWVPDETVPYCCRPTRTDELYAFPEVMKVAADEPDPSTVTLLVENTAGTNSGYTLKADFKPLAAVVTPKPTPRVTPKVSARPVDRFEDFGAAPELRIATPRPTPRTVIVPGPDGQPMEVELPVVAAGNRRPVRVRTVNPAALAVAILLGVTVIAAGVTALTRRRRART